MMESSSAQPPGLSQQLKSATAALHRRLEGSTFMASLLRGQVDRAHYAGLLRNLQALYAALEEALLRHAGTSAVAPVVIPELFRSRAIATDLQVLAGGVSAGGAPLARATQQYVERLHELSTTQPGLLVAHAYVRYLGDLNGGQALRRVVARSLGLTGDAGTTFYDFGDHAARQRLLLRFRAALHAVDEQTACPEGLVAEAVHAFELHEQLFEQLALPG
jgi:heme oxygenase